MIRFTVNTRPREVEVEPEMPLLWVLRDELDVKGPKYGCGVGQCGACTVHVDGAPTRACAVPVGQLGDARIVTIEGLSTAGDHPVQKAWIAHQVPQCGYCQSGQIMTAVALLRDNPKPSDADIDAAMTNICRCGTYQRIRKAVHVAAGLKAKGGKA